MKRPNQHYLLAAARQPARRDGLIALVLFLMPWVVLALLRRRHLDVGILVGVIAALAATSIGLSTLWLTWAALREAKRSGSQAIDLDLGQVADQLAIAVGTQWEAETAIRRLNDPYPLPVSWTAADPSLTDSWSSLAKLATSGAGWPLPPPWGTWAVEPDDLAGAGGDLVEVMARVPTGRLVVLGEPGSGKTMLMVRLVLDLLARRTAGAPVPFLAPVASWNPAEEDLRSWLGSQLLIGHPALAGLPPDGMTETNKAAALLASGLIMPILDGLDEISGEVRGSAIIRINDVLRPGEHVVVTCRSKDYEATVRPEDGLEVTLRGAAAIQLQPLDSDTVRRYILDDAAGPIAKSRWDPVLNVLGTEAPVGQALQTPLLVGLARIIYNPRPGELVKSLPNPEELCEPALADPEAVEYRLFDAFIPAAYRYDAARGWREKDAERWLVFLAQHLEYAIAGPDLAWWQLRQAVPRIHKLLNRFDAADAPARVRLDLPSMAIWLSIGLIVGVVVGIAWGIVAGIAGGFGIALGPAIVSGFWGEPGDLPRAASPSAVLARDRRASLFLISLLMFGMVLAEGLIAGLAGEHGLELVLFSGIGFLIGVIAGILFSIGQTAWLVYMPIRLWLAIRHHLPWSLMDFLADAHKRGVLRQAGAIYQFRHIQLQHRLASRAADKQ